MQCFSKVEVMLNTKEITWMFSFNKTSFARLVVILPYYLKVREKSKEPEEMIVQRASEKVRCYLNCG